MSAPESLQKLCGDWKGTSTLYTPWLAPPESTSTSTARVGLIVNGRFVRIEYAWHADGAAQEGVLLVGYREKAGIAEIVWCDSWHQSAAFLLSAGTAAGAGPIEVLGHYPAPEGPDWGWRTTVRSSGDDGWELVMHNLSPEGDETLAFHNVYQRA